MFGEIHYQRVVYQHAPQPGHRYRQIAVVERNQFELYVYEGDVLSVEPWCSGSDTADVRAYPTLQAAREEAEREYAQSLRDGWQPYSPIP